jgi:hypothetical protein
LAKSGVTTLQILNKNMQPFNKPMAFGHIGADGGLK